MTVEVNETGQVVVREPQTRVVQTETALVKPQETEMLAVAAQWSTGIQNLFVQPTDPGLTIPGLWVQTGLGVGGQDMTFWVEDGT